MDKEVLVQHAKLIIEELEKGFYNVTFPDEYDEAVEIILLYLSAKKIVERYG